MLRLKKWLVLMTAFFVSAGPSIAATRLFDFTARIDQPNSVYATGTVFHGNFGYDDQLTPVFVFPTGNGNGAVYNSNLIIFSFSISGQTFGYGGSAIVFDATSAGGDPDGFSLSGRDVNTGIDLNFSIYGGENNITMFTGFGLPTSFPQQLWQGPFADPNDDDSLTVPSGELFYYDRNTNTRFSSLILNVRPSGFVGQVPEPGTWALMLFGFGLVGAGMRHKRRVNKAVCCA